MPAPQEVRSDWTQFCVDSVPLTVNVHLHYCNSNITVSVQVSQLRWNSSAFNTENVEGKTLNSVHILNGKLLERQ